MNRTQKKDKTHLFKRQTRKGGPPKIDMQPERAGTRPALGRVGRVAETPYIVPYRVRGEAVEILRVFHAARKWPEKTLKRESKSEKGN
jgi:plasmid stabilization system protein ParE